MPLLTLNDSLYTGAPVEKEITFTNASGEEITGTVFVKQYGIAQTKRLLKAVDESNSDSLAEGIAEHIVDDKGKPLYKPEDVQRFCQPLILALLAAIGEVNNPKPIVSADMTSSSVN